METMSIQEQLISIMHQLKAQQDQILAKLEAQEKELQTLRAIAKRAEQLEPVVSILPEVTKALRSVRDNLRD